MKKSFISDYSPYNAKDKEIIQRLNANLKTQASETIIGDENYFYAFRVNVIFSMLEDLDADEVVQLVKGVDTFFESLKITSYNLYNPSLD